MERHRAEEEQITQHREGKVILDLAIEQIAAAEASKHIAAVAIALVVVAIALVDEEDEMDVEHEEAADEADTEAAIETEAVVVAARQELLCEETADEPVDIAGNPADIAEDPDDTAASEDSLEPNMNQDTKLSECTAFIQKNTKQMMEQRLENHQ